METSKPQWKENENFLPNHTDTTNPVSSNTDQPNLIPCFSCSVLIEASKMDEHRKICSSDIFGVSSSIRK